MTFHRKQMKDMPDKEMLKVSVEEFSRLQDYMSECEKDSVVYKKMKRRYIELKVMKYHNIVDNQKDYQLLIFYRLKKMKR